jgi:hypothetical protein
MGNGHTDSTSAAKKGYELSTIESLLGSEGLKVLFGMLTQVRNRLQNDLKNVGLQLDMRTKFDITSCNHVV